MNDIFKLMKSADSAVKARQGNDVGGLTLPIRLDEFVESNGVLYAKGTNLLNNQQAMVSLMKNEGQTKRGMDEIRKVTQKGDTLIFESSYESRSEQGKWQSYYAQTPDNIKLIRGQEKRTQTVIGMGTARKTRNGYDRVNVFESRLIRDKQVIDGTFISVADALAKPEHFGGAYAQNTDEMVNYVMGMWDKGKDVFIRVMMKDENGHIEKVTYQASRLYAEMNSGELYNRSATQAKLKEFVGTVKGILEHESFKQGLANGTSAIELLNTQKWMDGQSAKLDPEAKSTAKKYGLSQKGGFFTNHRDANNEEDKYGQQVVTMMVVPGQSIEVENGETPMHYLRDGWNSIRSIDAKFLTIDNIASPFFKPSESDYIYRTKQQDGTYKLGKAPAATQNANQAAPVKQAEPVKQQTAAKPVAPATEPKAQKPAAEPKAQKPAAANVDAATHVQVEQTSQSKAVDTKSEPDFDDFDFDDLDVDALIGGAVTEISQNGPKP